MVGGGRDGNLKTLQKLEKCVEAGNYYEAQQMYKTVYARYVAAKKYAAALELLQSGASVQLRHGQVTCGVELGVLLVETLGKAGMKYDMLALERIKSIVNSFPREDLEACDRRKLAKTSEAYLAAKTRVDGFCTFMKAAIRWCIETGGPSRGPSELHDILAEYIWTQYPELELNRASVYFVRSGHPEKYARALIACMNECDPEEGDFLLARSVLLYLTLGNLRDANRLMNEVKKGLGEKSYPNTPLVQFIKYLLLTLERDALPMLHSLRESYKDHLERDSTLTEYLDAVAEKFYGVQHKNGLQRMFGDFVKMFATE